MDKAKAKIGEVLHRSGEKDTTVHETVAPAVQKETVVPTRHEETQVAVDKEIHQDHYHTSIQPIKDSEVLPEKHVTQIAGTEERTIQHGSPEDDRAKVAAAAGGFKDERFVADTRHTASDAAVTGGTHIHHHIHETIQPVVHKETIQPEVVHTVKPVHEVHQNAAVHHGTHELPPISKSELEAKGVSLQGREERYDHFPGEPKTIGGQPTATTGTTGVGSTSSNAQIAASTAATTHSSSGTVDPSATGTTSSTTTSKPSLMDKINPKVDATGDGNPGFMK